MTAPSLSPLITLAHPSPNSDPRPKAGVAEQVEHGNIILHSTAFAIIIAAPIGLLVIALLGPVWLTKVHPLNMFQASEPTPS